MTSASQHFQYFAYLFYCFGLGFLAPEQQVQKVVVCQIHQFMQAPSVTCSQFGLVTCKKTCDEEVVFQQPATAPPFELAQATRIEPALRCCTGRTGAAGFIGVGFGRHGAIQTVRRTIISLILPMALVGFNPLGQTSTQFMIVWQRNSRYGSSRLSRRSAVASSRLSAMKR
mgnify:CR=1 FL=1